MEIIKVGICLDDWEFSEKLAEGLSREYRGLQLYLLDNLNSIEALDLVIASRTNGLSKVIEAKQSMEYCNLESEPFSVCIYKDCPNLINDLLYIYFRLTGKVCGYRGEHIGKTIAFSSTCRAIDTTRISLEIGKHLNRVYRKKCLYINLCPVDESHDILPHKGDSLLKLMFYLGNSENFPIYHFITEGNDVDCLNTGIINSYSDEMTVDLFQKLIFRVEELGLYSFIFIDVGNHISRSIKSLLDTVDYLVLVGRNQATEVDRNIQNEIESLRRQKHFLCVFWEDAYAYGKEIADISKKIVEDCDVEFRT